MSAPEASSPEADVSAAELAPSDLSPTPLPPTREDPELAQLRRRANQVLLDGAEDLGLELAWVPLDEGHAPDESLLLQRAAEGWVMQLGVERDEAGLSLRLIAVAPRESMLRVLRRQTTPERLEVSILRLLRDLVRSAKFHGELSTESPGALAPHDGTSPRDTDGRAYLAVTGALVGGYVGYSLEHIAGSSETRLIFPLMTLGAGVGVAASLVAADEWQVTTGEAWYLSATTVWSTTSALLITDGTELDEPSHRHAYGLLGTAAGLSLGTLALSLTDIEQGGALLTHSGAFFGGVFGGLTERWFSPDLQNRPSLGLGIGIGVGTLGAGFLATQLPNPPQTRVVYVNLSAVLGGLTGAAGASPLIVGEDVTQTENRIWIGSVVLGTLIGGGIGYLLTNGQPESLGFEVRPALLEADFGERHGPKAWALGATGSF